MELELLIGLAVFSFASSITPGPNNLMLMASGANYGLKRTIPHMLGVGMGFAFMIVVVGLGLVSFFNSFPESYLVLKIVSVIYLLYLAKKIATAAAPDPEANEASQGTPFSFIQAAAFQWVNPKAWTMALTSIAVYAPNQDLNAVLFVAFMFGFVNLPCVGAWAAMGYKLKGFLSNPRKLQHFNYVMAGLLVLSLYPVVIT